MIWRSLIAILAVIAAVLELHFVSTLCPRSGANVHLLLVAWHYLIKTRESEDTTLSESR